MCIFSKLSFGRASNCGELSNIETELYKMIARDIFLRHPINFYCCDVLYSFYSLYN